MVMSLSRYHPSFGIFMISRSQPTFRHPIPEPDGDQSQQDAEHDVRRCTQTLTVVEQCEGLHTECRIGRESSEDADHKCDSILLPHQPSAGEGRSPIRSKLRDGPIVIDLADEVSEFATNDGRDEPARFRRRTMSLASNLVTPSEPLSQ